MLLVLLACEPMSSRFGSGSGDTAESGSVDGDTSGADPDLRSATFTGVIATVAQNPLGLGEESRGAAAVATLTWDLSVADSDAGDPERGSYEHQGTSGLIVELAGHVIAGSGSAAVETYAGTGVSFGMDDGANLMADPHPLMFVDGVADESMGLFFAIVDPNGIALANDSLPETLSSFDPVEHPHTFSLEGAGGTLLLQFNAVSP